MSGKRIIFVDDDPRVLSGIERMMMFMDNDWEMEFLGSGSEALESLARSPFDVVVSDMRMPGMHEKNIPFWQAEQEVIGGSHAEVGAYLLGLLGLPDSIVEAVAFHHKPTLCIDQSFSALTAVHVANCLESELGTGDNCGSEKSVDLDYLEALGLVDRLQKWREQAKELKQ